MFYEKINIGCFDQGMIYVQYIGNYIFRIFNLKLNLKFCTKHLIYYLVLKSILGIFFIERNSLHLCYLLRYKSKITLMLICKLNIIFKLYI